MGEQTLDHAMRICIEGPETLSAETLDAVLDHYKETKIAFVNSVLTSCVVLSCTCTHCASDRNVITYYKVWAFRTHPLLIILPQIYFLDRTLQRVWGFRPSYKTAV